jgi:hypothetical protein
VCIYDSVIGAGTLLALQLLTVISIFSSIAFWIWIYRKEKVELRQYAIPITLWVVFGTLDILITAKGTFEDPFRESNPLARFIFVEVGFWGPVVASILWIALWSGIVLAINKTIKINQPPAPLVSFVSLSIFYALAAGHLFGFSSWYTHLCGIARLSSEFAWGSPKIFLIVFLGSMLAALHFSINHFVTLFYKRNRNK